MKTPDKNIYRLKGKLFNYSINEKGMMELILYTGLKSNAKIFLLTTFNPDLIKNITKMIENNGVKRFSVKFDISCKKYTNRYYTNLIIKECSEWKTIKNKLIQYNQNINQNLQIKLNNWNTFQK